MKTPFLNFIKNLTLILMAITVALMFVKFVAPIPPLLIAVLAIICLILSCVLYTRPEYQISFYTVFMWAFMSLTWMGIYYIEKSKDKNEVEPHKTEINYNVLKT